MTALYAITVWQPWATLIAEECKPFEFRKWAPHQNMIGKRIAIHAGSRPVREDEVRDLLRRLHSPFWRETGLKREESIKLLTPALTAPRSLVISHVVCTAVLGVPIQGAQLAEKMGIYTLNDRCRNEHKIFGWPLSDVRRLVPPQHAKGRQGWWKWSAPDA